MLAFRSVWAILLSPVWVAAVGGGIEGDRKPVVRELPAFTSVEIRGPADVTITVDKDAPLTIAAAEEISERIQTEVIEGRLIISCRGEVPENETPEIKVFTAKLTAVKVASSADVKVTGIKSETFSAAVEGSGDVRLAGATDNLTISAKGSADVHAAGLTAEQATVAVDGSCDVRLHAEKKLTVTVNGTGDVTYSGSPKVTAVVNGSGNVKKSDS